jgi:hypothetical protein
MRSFARIVVVSALVTLGVATSAAAAPIAQVTGFSVSATNGATQNGKLQHGSPSACSPAKAAPGVDNSGTQFNYQDLALTSFINEPACVSVSFVTSDPSCWSNGLYSASYLGTFDPSNIQTNYLGDSGSSPNDPTPKAYSMTLPAGGVLDTVFHTSAANSGCSSFDVTWSSDRPWTTTLPRISGHPFAGESLTAFDGQWSAGTPTRQWRRCDLDGSSCSDIPGATASTYVVAPDDVGRSLRLRVSDSDSGFTSTSDSASVITGIQIEALTGSRSPARTRQSTAGSCSAAHPAPAPRRRAAPRPTSPTIGSMTSSRAPTTARARSARSRRWPPARVALAEARSAAHTLRRSTPRW